jgi:Protein of unknown function (DUF3079)
LRRRKDAALAGPYNHHMARLPLNPRHPDRICWGCDRYCSVDDLGCANGTIRTPHPAELFGDDWVEWLQEKTEDASTPVAATSR